MGTAALAVVLASLSPFHWMGRLRHWLWFTPVAISCVLVLRAILRQMWWNRDKKRNALQIIAHAEALLQDAWEGASPSKRPDFARLLTERLTRLKREVE
jgi:hypothetical protein